MGVPRRLCLCLLFCHYTNYFGLATLVIHLIILVIIILVPIFIIFNTSCPHVLNHIQPLIFFVFLFPSFLPTTIIFITIISASNSSFFMTCPNHLNQFSIIMSSYVYISFVLISSLFTPLIHLNIFLTIFLISVQHFELYNVLFDMTNSCRTYI